MVRNQGHRLAVGLSSSVNRQTVLEVKSQLIFCGQQAARNRCVVPQICQAVNERELRHKRVARFCRAQVIRLDQLVIQQEAHLSRFPAHRTGIAVTQIQIHVAAVDHEKVRRKPHVKFDRSRMQTGAGELAAVLGKLLKRNLLIGVDPRRRVISLAVRFTLEVFNRDHASDDAGIGRRQITSGCQQVVSVAAGNHQNFGVQTVRRIYDRNRRRFDSGQELQEVGTTVIGNKSDIVLLGRLFVVVDRKFNSAPLGAHTSPRCEHGGCFFEVIVGRRSKNHRQRRCGRTDGVDKRCRQNRKIVG